MSAAAIPGAVTQAERGEDRAPAGARAQADRIRIEQHSASGLVWLIGWLFTIGFLQVPFWKGVLAIILWPFYLGSRFSSLLP